MDWFIFAAIVLGIVAGIGGVYLIIRSKIRRISRSVFGTSNLMEGLRSVESEQENQPRSLNGCDTLLLPKILKDFPDFDPNMAKTYAREYIENKLSDKEQLTIHNVVFARYLRSRAQKTIVMQAALSHREDNKLMQKRYALHYSFVIHSDDPSVAANCPNCGGALGFGEIQCPYCGSRVTNVLANTWKFTEFIET